MRKYLLILAILISTVQYYYAQPDSTFSFGEVEAPPDHYFGFNFIPSLSGNMTHYGYIKLFPDGSHKITHLDRESFIRQISGEIPSPANPKRKNYFQEYGIQNPGIIDSLWKLRYMYFPYQAKRDTVGWANGMTYKTTWYLPNNQKKDTTALNLNLPSSGQMKMLAKFGIQQMSDFIYGDNALRLLKSLENDAWKSAYKDSI